MNNKKVLLTGATGFLGSSLALGLLRNEYEVSILLRPTSKLDRLAMDTDKFSIFRYVDDTDINNIVYEISPNVIIHTACCYGRNGETVLQMEETNVRFGLQIIQALQTLNQNCTFINTGTVLDTDVNLYSATKNHFSKLGKMLAEDSNNKINFINVLLQHMYGPHDDISKFTTYVLRTCLKNEPTLNLTAGTQLRDFIYIDDVVDAYLAILRSVKRLPDVLDIEVGSGKAITIKSFVEIAHRLCSSGTRLNFGQLPLRSKDAFCHVADISALQQLGWEAKFDLEKGLTETLEKEKIEN